MIKTTALIVIAFISQIAWGQNPPSSKQLQPVKPKSSVTAPEKAMAPAPNTSPSTDAEAKSTTPTIGTGDEAIYDMAPQVEYIYDPTGKKDPFKPYKAPRIRGDNRPAPPVDPLSLVEVNQLRLVAVLWNTAKPRAVVKDSQNRNFILFKNMKIGRNEGVVVDIREGEIVIVEKFDDGFGNTVREARVLEMTATTDASAAGG